jgi:hypothetical protein
MAFSFHGYPVEQEETFVPYDPPEFEEYGNGGPLGEYVWDEVEDTSRAIVVMVGDDRKFTVDMDDLSPIEDEEYCHGCGQIGCTAEKGIYE